MTASTTAYYFIATFMATTSRTTRAICTPPDRRASGDCGATA